MIPSYEQSVEIETITNKSRKEPKMIPTYQLWQKNGSCPIGTIPIRRIREKDLLNFESTGDCGRKGPSFPPQLRKPDYTEDSNFLQVNRSVTSFDCLPFPLPLKHIILAVELLHSFSTSLR